MKILNKQRGGGKTTEAIIHSNKEWKYILTTDRKRVEQIAKLAKDLEIDIPFPITVDELIRSQKLRGSNIRGLIIDELDDVLHALTGYEVSLATLTEK